MKVMLWLSLPLALLVFGLLIPLRRERERQDLERHLLRLVPCPAPTSWHILAKTQHRLAQLLNCPQGDERVVTLSHDPRVQEALHLEPRAALRRLARAA